MLVLQKANTGKYSDHIIPTVKPNGGSIIQWEDISLAGTGS